MKMFSHNWLLTDWLTDQLLEFATKNRVNRWLCSSRRLEFLWNIQSKSPDAGTSEADLSTSGSTRAASSWRRRRGRAPASARWWWAGWRRTTRESTPAVPRAPPTTPSPSSSWTGPTPPPVPCWGGPVWCSSCWAWQYDTIQRSRFPICLHQTPVHWCSGDFKYNFLRKLFN